MRVFSYLFHGLLILFLLGISAVALSSGQSLHLAMLPGHGAVVAYGLLFAALAGLLALALAIRGTWRPLFLLWSAAVLVAMVRGYFLSPYTFDGHAEFHHALWLSAGALMALLGAWFQSRQAPAR